MKKWTILVVSVALVGLAYQPAAAATVEIKEASNAHFRDGAKPPKKQEVTQVIELDSSHDWELCVFGNNSQGKKSKFNVTLTAYGALANGPIAPQGMIGEVKGVVKLEKDGGTAFGLACATLSVANSLDYAIAKIQILAKTSRNIKNGEVATWGLLSLPAATAQSIGGTDRSSLRWTDRSRLGRDQLRAAVLDE